MKNVCLSVLLIFAFIAQSNAQVSGIIKVARAIATTEKASATTMHLMRAAIILPKPINPGFPKPPSLDQALIKEQLAELKKANTFNYAANKQIIESFTQKTGTEKGFNNEDVLKLQEALNLINNNSDLNNVTLKVYGLFGKETITALNKFNREKESLILKNQITKYGYKP